MLSGNRKVLAAPGKSSSHYVKKRRWNILKRLLIALIKLYRKYLSPMKTTKCPYYPTCSTYGLEAIEKHGALKGSLLAGWRILRCNPFSKGGYDPVP
ncbi:MAG: membrane protein insertion efficiency factor YidD [Lachnospiraceae bacterium]|nr:membrane protein insertion efficiency factor YidD [Lachnospiraceae bacterium]